MDSQELEKYTRVRLIDANALKENIEECMTAWDEHTDYGIGRLRSYEWAIELIDNAPTVEPCYQTTFCLDCANYDKENHNCPRFCEVIKEVIKSIPN